MKNKKAVSVMIGYVLLVSLAVIMGGIVYTWMSSYVPADIEEGECDDGVSLFVTNAECANYINGPTEVLNLNLKLKNNGRFNMGGYFIYATNDSNQTIATIDLSQGIQNLQKLNPGVKFAGKKNSFEPGYNITHNFQFANPTFNRITSIEIIPVRWESDGSKEKVIACSAAKIREKITCEDNYGGGEIGGEEWRYTTLNYPINEDSNPKDLFWDGINWWVLGDNNDRIYRYNSTWGYELYSKEVDDGGNNPRSIFWDESYWWVLNGGAVYRYNSTWDYTSYSKNVDGGSQAMDIFWNGTSWFLIVDGGFDSVYQYNSSWGYITNYSLQSTQPQSLFWDGINWWVSDFGGGDEIHKYYSNWTFTGETYNVNAQDTSPRNIFQDDTYWWMLGDVSNRVYQYETGSRGGST